MKELIENPIEKPIEVYIKINENNFIIEVASSDFLDSTTGYIKIDEGFGDKYRHAQCNYFDLPLTDDEGNYNYKYENGKIINNQTL